LSNLKSNMNKILLVNTYQKLSEQLLESLKRLGSEAMVVKANDFLLDIGNGDTIKPKFINKNLEELTIDAGTVVFMTTRKPNKTYSSLFLNLCKALQAKVLDPAFLEMNKSTSKHLQYIRLVAAGMRIPRTVLVRPSMLEIYKPYICSQFETPFVVKGFGSCGKTVWKVNSLDELQQILVEVDKDRKEVLVIQEFVENSHEEFRVLCLLGKPIATIARSSENFLNNHAQGGRVNSAVLSDRELAIATEAALISGLDYVGVDFMKDKNDNMIFLELQTGPDIEVSKIADPDVISKIARELSKLV